MNFYDAGDEDNFYTRLMGFEQSCMEEADPMFFRASAVSRFCSARLLRMIAFGCWSVNAIRNADCPEDMGGSSPSPSPPPPAGPAVSQALSRGREGFGPGHSLSRVKV